MAVTGIAAAFDDNIGVRFEQADEFLAGRYRLPRQHPPLALRDNPLDQRLIMADLGLPKSNARLRSKRVALLLIDIDQCSDSSKQDLNAVMLKWAERYPAVIVHGPLNGNAIDGTGAQTRTGSLLLSRFEPRRRSSTSPPFA